MTTMSIDINRAELKLARDLVGVSSNDETVALAIRTLIAIHRQPATVTRLIGHSFDADQIDAPTVEPKARGSRRH